MIAAVAALVCSCQKAEDEKQVSANGGYSFDFTIAPGGFETTKGDATVGWTVGEKVFVFFKPDGGDLISDGYVAFTYKEDGSWDSASTLSDGSLGTAGKMSAVYVPYLAAGVEPEFAGDTWTIDGGDVYYACASGDGYTVKDGTVYGKLAMRIPEGYVQFAVPYATAGDGATMACNIVEAYDCVALGTDMSFAATPSGVAMNGHKDDNGTVYFWGMKNSSSAADCEITLTTASGNLVKTAAADAIAGNKSFNITGLVEEPLPGVFSVSETKQVRFSKGNLQATYNGSKYTWGFAANQYDYVGEESGNTTIDSPSVGDVVDLFGWSTASSYYGISTSVSNSDYAGDFVDWGTAIDSEGTWRTLTDEEWGYLTGSSTERGGKNLWSSVCGVQCRVIAPDNWDVDLNPLQSSYDAASWKEAEAAGLICLSPVGSRSAETIYKPGETGFYYSATNRDNYVWYYTTSNKFVQGDKNYYVGLGVRLVTDVPASR